MIPYDRMLIFMVILTALSCFGTMLTVMRILQVIQ